MAEAGSKSYRKDALIYIESDEDSDAVFLVESGEVALRAAPGMPVFRQSLRSRFRLRSRAVHRTRVLRKFFFRIGNAARRA